MIFLQNHHLFGDYFIINLVRRSDTPQINATQ